MKEFINKLIGRLEEESYLVKPRGRSTTDYGDTVVDIGDAIDIVNELTEEYINTSTDTSSGWIPCSERLPKEDGYYLTTIRFYHLHNLVVMGCNFEDGKWLYMDGDDEVIAWQPLPAPYKEGE